jgi:peroxin-12
MLHFLYFKGQYFSFEYHLLGHKITRMTSDGMISSLALFVLLFLKGMELFSTSTPALGSSQLSGRGSEVRSIDPPWPVSNSSSTIGNRKCGVCRLDIVNPTALDVSGYVFCYICIKNHVDTFRKCPVTGEAASPENLRKIHI